MQCLPAGSTVHGNGVHHAAGKDRHEQIGNGCYHHGAGDAGYQPSLASPMAKEKGQYVTHYVLTTPGNTHRSLTRTTGRSRGISASTMSWSRMAQGRKLFLRGNEKRP